MLCFVNHPFTKRSMDDQIAAESQIARAKPVAERRCFYSWKWKSMLQQLTFASKLSRETISRKSPSKTPSILRRNVAALPFSELISPVTPRLVTELLAARAKASKAYRLDTLAVLGNELWVR